MLTHKLRIKYPDKVPIIITMDKKCKTIKDVGTIKYLVQDNITIAQFVYIMRKRIKLEAEEAIYLYGKLDNTQHILMAGTDMLSVYDLYKNNEDGILYMTYTGENVFG